MVGMGAFSSSYALAQVGWAGLLLLLLYGGICCYTGVLLQRCLDRAQLTGGTYPDLGQARARARVTQTQTQTDTDGQR